MISNPGGWMARAFMVTAAAATLLGVELAAQSTEPDTLRVGDSRIDGSVIESFRVKWRATPWDSLGQPAATNTVDETVEVIVTDQGNELLRFTQTWNDTLGSVLFVTARVAERNSMGYRAFHTGRAPGGIAHLDFDGDRVAGFYAPQPEAKVIEYSLRLDEPPVASFGGLLFAALPFEPGLHGVYPAFGWGGTSNPALRWQPFRIIAKEPVRVAGIGEIDAWRIEATSSNGTKSAYLVTKQAPYFVQLEISRPDASRTLYEVIEWAKLDHGS